MNKVPKCVECKYHDYNHRNTSSYTQRHTYQKYHWCDYGYVSCVGYQSRLIYVKDMKTSPKWCPKRDERWVGK